MRDIWNIDHVIEACGYFTARTTVNNGYGCRHPEQQDVEDERGPVPPRPATCGRCFAFTCPLGSELSPSEDPEDRQEFIDRDMDPADFSDGEWMLVEVDPVGALVGAAPPRETA